MAGQPQPGRQIEAVFPQHQHQIAAEIRCRQPRRQRRQSALQLVGIGAGLGFGLGADQGQTLHHPEGGIAGALRQGPAGRQHHMQSQPLTRGHQGPQIGP